MSTAPTTRRAKLHLVPKPEGTIDADWIAYEVMSHIDEMYPAMWLAVAKAARVSVRNTIVRAVMAEAKR